MSSFVPSYVTAFVAVMVAIISYRQWRTAHDRLRLDLYNRRLELYLTVRSVEDVLVRWSGTENEKIVLDKFKRAQRESRFLFPPESGVFELFEEYGEAIIKITALEALKRYEKSNEPEKNTDWQKVRVDAYSKSILIRADLDNRVTPLLEFNSSGDPLGWIKRRRARASRRRRFARNAQHAREGITKMNGPENQEGQ
jgi:hypothetical protein